MFELFETNPPVNVQEPEYKRLLGYPKNHALDGRPRELANWARQWYAENGRPWFYARQMNALELANGKLRVAGTEFSSKQLHDQFAEAQADSAVLVAVSAGRECEEKARQLWQESKPDEYFFMEMFGSAVVEHLVTVASGRICGWADQNGMAVLPHYSPGYSGWDISDQIKLWNLIRQNGAAHFDGKLDVMETGMLRPKKSQLTVFGVTRNLAKARSLAKLIPCENCSLPNCQYRRAPYRHAPPQIEDVRSLLSNVLGNFGGRNNASVLKTDAKYTINLRALEKWSKERLQLDFLRDGAVEARFRYEGTTCSNMGRALEFDYRVKLAPPEDHYRILEMHCAPAPGDTGHQFQCEYLNDAKTFMRSIAAEKPLLGKPLNEVLTWEWPWNPSGCYCDAERRAHKWGLVFEVIHYALVRHELEMADGHAGTILKKSATGQSI
jgi:hypothetical protein